MGSLCFEFYRDEYGGTLPIGEYADLLPAAVRHVDWICGGRIPCVESDMMAWKRAVCCCVDAFAEFGQGEVGGFDLGSVRVTNYSNQGTTGAEIATAEALKELSGSGLLFTGAGR